jgi:diadenosine tetraphosphatase ApaH/serine/threonine PP2A family protein phosphatase
MKIGIVSDTHSNLYALQSVLNHMDSVGVDLKVHLGDIVTFGPNPTETLSLTLEKFNYIVMGANDQKVVEPNSNFFNPKESADLDFTRSKLSKGDIDVLDNLGYGHLLNDMLFVHGSPNADDSLLPIINENDAKLAFSNPIVDFKVAFVGGTHKPFVWRESTSEKLPLAISRDSITGTTLSVKEKSIVNVGSVGAPLDGDPRASYAIYDTGSEAVTFIKVPYAIEKTVASMQRNGFSMNAYERIIYGR